MYLSNSKGKALLDSYVYWLQHYNWTYFIALHFKSDFQPSKEVAEIKVRNLCTRLNKYLNGRNSNTKLSVFAVAENSKAGVPHVHLFIGAENELCRCMHDIKSAVSYYWSKLSGCINPLSLGKKNNGWFTGTDENKGTVISYMCKEFLAGNDPVLIGALNFPNTK